MVMHISRSWYRDIFAPHCGCELLKCGHVDQEAATKRNCKEHSALLGKTIRSGHNSLFCSSV